MAYKEQMCTIVINGNFNIELPVIVAAAVSSPITRMIENDPTMTKFTFNIPIKGKDKNCLQKIKSVLVSNESVKIENENDVRAFATFGLLFGNKDFILPLDEQCKEECQKLSEANVFSNLETKRIYGITDTTVEADFLAQNFQELSDRKIFLEFAKKPANVGVVEQIVRSKKLKVDTEDTLLTFLITINRENAHDSRFISLFENVFLEYCTLRKCDEFLTFVNERSPSNEMRTLISCIGRRLLQPNIPMSNPYIEGRHKPTGIAVPMDDPMNGILRRENQKANVTMDASSTCSGSVYDLIKADPNADFITRNEENSTVTASLKDGKTFVLTSYMIRGRKYDKGSSHLQNWRIEGQKSSNGEWIKLDQHENEPFDKLMVKTFALTCKEQLRAVRLIQEGKTTYDNFNLCINAFDVFGFLFEQ